MGKKTYDFESAVKNDTLPDLSKRLKTNEKKGSRQKPTINSVPFYRLYRFRNGFDTLIILLMVLSSAAVGVAFPLNILIFKDVVNILVSPKEIPSYKTALLPLISYFAILASSIFVCSFIQILCVTITAERQGRRYKDRYFSALLRQEISWFDKQQSGQLITKLTDGIESIEVAIADKVSQFVQHISSFIGSLIIALCYGWELTLAGCLSVPLLTLAFFFMIHFLKKYSIAQIRAYSVAGGIAEEIISGVRTVIAFNAQEKEVKRYTMNLSLAEKYGFKKALYQGIATGAIGLSIFSVASLLFYLGIRFVQDGKYTPGVVVQIFLTIIIGSISLGNAIPMIENFMTAKAVGYSLFEVIDKKPSIDPQTPGIILDTFDGDITFSNIYFEYPTRAGVQVLKNFNFIIPCGKTVAFIGPSGSGKSTIIHLLQRFYDPVSGTVSLNGVDLKMIDLNWYRSSIGVVHQEPPLFSGSVESNIRLGKGSATFEEIVNATKDSNAFDFIMKTKEQFNTELGDGGAGFSGGQKQRIAIATAMVRDPKLLLLDEATSALDNASEKLVQNTLDRAILSHKRTVVMVAHRLQTVRNADIIVVMKDGEIVEQGKHDELVSLRGIYYEMLETQKMKESQPDNGQSRDDVGEDIIDENVYDEPQMEDVQEEVTLTEKVQRFQFIKDFIRVMNMNKPEASALTIGVIASIVVGATFPGLSLIYAQMFLIFSYVNDKATMTQQGNLFCGLLLLPAFVLMVFQFLKIACLGKAGEALTTRIRSKLMEAMLKQEVSWFDQVENIPGVLTARLAIEASLVKGIAGIQLSVYIETLANVVASLTIGFYFSWMLTLLFFCFLPFITISGILQGRLSSNQRITNTSQTDSSSLVMETLNNIRTVQSLGLQNHFSNLFLNSLRIKRRNKTCKFILFGIMTSIGASSIYFSYCVIFYVGSILIDLKMIEMIQLMRVFACFTISSQSLGRALALAPDVDKAREATRRTLSTIDRVSVIKADPSIGIVPETKLTGCIEFRDISFRYPTRLNVEVLRNLNLKVNAGETVALVGHSGCGKSTLIQLLERYYDPSNIKENEPGQILLDGRDLKGLNLRWVRNQLGLVKQEPSLFNMTIQENIAYSCENESNFETIQQVAKMANIHEFISALPEGYDTKVGQRGGHLSGGQKQRICIARALYNKPAILLLDEATSALDTESEKLVQDALDRAQANCTCLVIAHRFSTIQNADKIVVIDDGVVKESGTHGELMAKKGLFFDLNVEHVN